MTVVDASIVVRLLQNRQGDAEIRERFGQRRYVHAPTLIDAEVASAVRGLLLTSKPAVKTGRGHRMGPHGVPVADAEPEVARHQPFGDQVRVG